MVKKRLTRADRVKLGISKIFGGQEYTFIDDAKNKKDALRSKKRFGNHPKYPIRVTKNKSEHKYEIWMKRRALK